MGPNRLGAQGVSRSHRWFLEGASYTSLKMTSLKVGDLVELHPGTGRLGTVLDVVESHPRWLLVYWHTPPNICINPLLENEEFLTLVGRCKESPARGARRLTAGDKR